jgi:Glycosyl hydrolase family 3 N terminal domain
VQQIAKSIGSIGARDSRAAALPWLYSPIIGLAHSQLWSRVYETFGEDPLLAATMGTAMINGIQASVYIVVLEYSTVLRLTVCTLQACTAVAVELCCRACLAHLKSSMCDKTAATAIAHTCDRSAFSHAAFCHIGRAVEAECIRHFIVIADL